MKAWASGLLVVTWKSTLPWPSLRYAFWRGPSSNASPWTEWPAAGTAGFFSEAVAVGFAGSSARVGAIEQTKTTRASRQAGRRIEGAPVGVSEGGGGQGGRGDEPRRGALRGGWRFPMPVDN